MAVSFIFFLKKIFDILPKNEDNHFQGQVRYNIASKLAVLKRNACLKCTAK